MRVTTKCNGRVDKSIAGSEDGNGGRQRRTATKAKTATADRSTEQAHRSEHETVGATEWYDGAGTTAWKATYGTATATSISAAHDDVGAMDQNRDGKGGSQRGDTATADSNERNRLILKGNGNTKKCSAR